MNDPETQAQMKELQEKMNDPQMKAIMDANPQMKAQMEAAMKMAQGGGDMNSMMPKGMVTKVKNQNVLTKMDGGFMGNMEILYLSEKTHRIASIGRLKRIVFCLKIRKMLMRKRWM